VARRVGAGEDLPVTVIERVAQRFGLGQLVADPVRVPGGLSNELWRLVSQEGVFAVKRMVVNADRPDFIDNVEGSFEVEWRAAASGVAMPQPVVVPSTRRALAEVDGSLFRVHRWVDGQPAVGSARQAAGLVAGIHAVGNPRWEQVPETAWAGDGWGADLAELARRVGRGPEQVLVVDSHRDLDRKNTLRTAEDVLVALDWDAAGPISAVHEAVSVAVDWSDDDSVVFAEAVQTYVVQSGVNVPPRPWVFAGWVAAQGGWLDYNARHRGDSLLGRAEVAGTLARLRKLAAGLDALLAAMATGAAPGEQPRS
jgi:hypothetical protein